jgi:hypothetical protein
MDWVINGVIFFILFAVKLSDKVWVLLIWKNELILETVIYFVSTPRLEKIVPKVPPKDAISCYLLFVFTKSCLPLHICFTTAQSVADL